MAEPFPKLGNGGGRKVFLGSREAKSVDFSQKLALQTIYYCHLSLFLSCRAVGESSWFIIL